MQYRKLCSADGADQFHQRHIPEHGDTRMGDSYFSRHFQEVRRVMVSSHELSRLQTPRCHLQRYIDLLGKYMPLVPFELIFNLDETGLSDWEERKREPVIRTEENGNLRRNTKFSVSRLSRVGRSPTYYA
jgi:hypothetical protein